METSIKLHQTILHILDANISTPVLSGDLLEINEEIEGFLIKHIQKMMGDGNLQNAVFKTQSGILSLCEKFNAGSLDFIAVSREVALGLFDMMVKNVDIPSCDLIVSHFQYNGATMLGLFKFNYKKGYCHYVNQTEEGVKNHLILQRALLPTENQRVDEFAIINLDGFSISLIEKEYQINGEKTPYWSTLFLQCQSELSSSKKLQIIEKAAKEVTKRHFEEDFTMVAQTKKAIAETLGEGNPIGVEEIAAEIFKEDEQLKQEYISEVQKKGLREQAFEGPEAMVGRRILNHKIKTDNGIEIQFPAHYYDDANKIEFVNHVDGSVSIIIKNVGIKF